jgi:hypothetical protein
MSRVDGYTLTDVFSSARAPLFRFQHEGFARDPARVVLLRLVRGCITRCNWRTLASFTSTCFVEVPQAKAHRKTHQTDSFCHHMHSLSHSFRFQREKFKLTAFQQSRIDYYLPGWPSLPQGVDPCFLRQSCGSRREFDCQLNNLQFLSILPQCDPEWKTPLAHFLCSFLSL